MHRIDNPSAATSMPQRKPAGPGGYYTAGNVSVGQEATIVEADWLNTVQEELVNVVRRGGLTLDKLDDTQLLRALANLFTGAYLDITQTQGIPVPDWATRIDFAIAGGGAGGAHCNRVNSGSNQYASGGGGGSGAYAEAQRPVTPGGLVLAVVGQGGGSEQAGGTTSIAFGEEWAVSATGGYPGVWPDALTSSGGAGGIASGGDVNANGTWGGDGQIGGSFQTTGYGGPGFWGGGGRSGMPVPGGNGNPGTGPGSGGGGVYDAAGTLGYCTGGSGAPGLIRYRFLP